MSSIDVLLLERRLRLNRNDLEVNAMCIANARAHFERNLARLEKQRDALEREGERLADDLRWLRLSELIHTPCWRYRVAS
jgi:hypothetical protein